MPPSHRYRQQRRRFFVGCEGNSEVGYAAFIRLLAEEAGLAVHLDVRKCQGGDPLAIVEAAVQELRRRKNRHGAYAGQAIFLDADRRGDIPDRTARADQLIREHEFRAIWSEPAFEALLLRHMPGCEQLKPATTALALQQLQDCWPRYGKAMTAKELRAKFDRAAVARAATVVPALRAFLDSIGLPHTGKGDENRRP